MSTRRGGLPVAALAFALAAGPAAATPVPKGTDVIEIDLVPGRFGAVRFEHARHTDEFTEPDGSRVRCRDCHHTLAAAEPSSPKEDMRCSGCHARLGESPRVVAGKVAPVLASRPEGETEVRAILFHKWCWDCHYRTKKNGRQNDRCKVCHPRLSHG
jgi:Zn finger protein HypA/HybF involved in hydrogenase expression